MSRFLAALLFPDGLFVAAPSAAHIETIHLHAAASTSVSHGQSQAGACLPDDSAQQAGRELAH